MIKPDPKFLIQRISQTVQSANRDSVHISANLCRVCVSFVFLSIIGGILGYGNAAEVSESFRIGFTSAMFTDINENDARAAIKVWGEMIARDQNVPTDPNPIIFKNIEPMLYSLKAKEIDAVGITTIEYSMLSHKVSFSPIFMTYHSESIFEQYVLLIHRKSEIKTLADLTQKSMCFYQNPRACLAPLWLDTLLVQNGHPTTACLTDKISWETKLTKAVLPVFFRQKDVCVVTRSGFNMMIELNPQLARQLIVLAESPEMVPAVFAFRADYKPNFKEKIISGIKNLKKTSAGQQVLTIFQSEDIEAQPAAYLETALELISTHKRIAGKKKYP